MGKSANPAFPDAHPTAPGGMSQKALVAEMVNKHGYDKDEATAMRWPDQIDAVIQGRLDREREAKQQTKQQTKQQIEEPDDVSALFDEIEQAHDEPEPEAEGTPLFIGMPDTKDYIFNGHRGAGPSSAERWMNCTASLGAARAFLETLTPNQQAEFAGSSTAARQGTTAHAAAETEARVVLGTLSAEEAEANLLELAVEPPDGEAYDEEMAEYITEYVALIKSYAHDRGEGNVLIEESVTAGIPLLTVDADGDPEVYEIAGSADCIVLPTKDEPEIVVGDLKYGEGVFVEVENNPQVRLYALGALDLIADENGELTRPVERVTYVIAQPRLGGIRTWTEDIDDLLDWRDEVLSKALTEALGGTKAGAKFSPSEEACQWCPARGTCAALTEHRVEAAAELFDVIVESEYEGEAFPETALMDDETLGKMYAQITGLTSLLPDIKEEVQRRLHRGHKVPGFHLVSYTPPRKWKPGAMEKITVEGIDGIDPEMLLREPTLVTPTQAVKLLGDGAEAVADLIDVPDKRPVVAPVNDRRKPWEGRPPEQMFPDMEEE